MAATSVSAAGAKLVCPESPSGIGDVSCSRGILGGYVILQSVWGTGGAGSRVTLRQTSRLGSPVAVACLFFSRPSSAPVRFHSACALVVPISLLVPEVVKGMSQKPSSWSKGQVKDRKG